MAPGVTSPGAVTAMVTAFDRVPQLLETLRRIAACEPPPAEILVHVDGNQVACADAVRKSFPAVRVLLSEHRIGPGGGRNALLAAASAPVVASFDDDSYPIDREYFAQIGEVMQRFPEAAVVCAGVYHQGETVAEASRQASWVADFVGCGCIYRMASLGSDLSYLPLAMAYGMEESDLALRLHERGARVLFTPWLRVFHDTDRSRHADPRVTAASVANLALLAFLRYPVTLWPVGALQCARRVQWLLKNGRRRGVGMGLAGIPRLVLRYWRMRQPLPAAAVWSYLHLRQRPEPAAMDRVTGSAVAMFQRLKTLLPDRPMPLRVWRGPFRGAYLVANPRTALRKIAGLYEQELNHWLERALPRVTRVLDVGANDGYFTFGCAAAFRRRQVRGEIVAFEPQLDQLTRLREGIARQPVSDVRIEVVQAFVGATAVDEITTLDALLIRGRQNTLIKIDVEGAEIDVVAGARSWFDPSNLFLIEVHRREYLDRLRRMFAEQGHSLQQVNQQPLAFLGREQRDPENWWLVSDLSV
jgi:GT2 family glycosyltransferase